MSDDQELDRGRIAGLLLDSFVEQIGLAKIIDDDTLTVAITELLVDLHLTYADSVGDAWEYAVERVELGRQADWH